MWFGIFRLGIWRTLYPGVQFSPDSTALDQFYRQMVPNTGPYDVAVNTDAVAALFAKIGAGILVTHSQSGTRDPGQHALSHDGREQCRGCRPPVGVVAGEGARPAVMAA